MKLNKKLNRKDFLKYGALLIGAPLLVSVNSSCAKITDTNDVEVTERIDRAITETPSFTAQKPLGKTNSNDVYKIPISTLFPGRGKVFMATRIVYQDNQVKLQTVVVNVIEKDDYYAQVTGLNFGDILLINPKESLNMLASIDRAGLRNRFIPGKHG